MKRRNRCPAPARQNRRPSESRCHTDSTSRDLDGQVGRCCRLCFGELPANALRRICPTCEAAVRQDPLRPRLASAISNRRLVGSPLLKPPLERIVDGALHAIEAGRVELARQLAGWAASEMRTPQCREVS